MTSGEQISGAMGRWVSRRIDALETARLERERRNDPVYVARQQRAQALQARAQAQQADITRQRSFDLTLVRLRRRSVTATYAAASMAGLGVVDIATGLGAPGANGAIPMSPGAWFIAAAVAGFVAVRSRTRAATAQRPAPIALPPVPAPVLPPGTTGAEEAARLAQAEYQLQTMIPAVAQLHSEAARDLQATIATVQPTTHALVERLELVAGIDAFAAPQAAEAAEALRRRLADGVRAYEQLIAATASLLAAPDPQGPASAMLDSAATNLEAYAAGLSTAAEVFDGPGA